MNDSGTFRSSRIGPTVRRLATWSVAALLLGAVLWAALAERPVSVDIALVGRGPLRVSVRDDGVTRIQERYVVSTPLSGRMRRISHDVGDAVVAQRTILVHMEPTDAELLDPRAVAQAQARVRAAQRRLEQAKAERKRTELLLAYAEREMGRIRRLLESNAASETEFLQQELEFRQQQENTAAATYAVDIAEYELELERAALLLTSTDEPAAGEPEEGREMVLSIPAPITGRILRIYQESSAVLQAGAPLLELGDPTDLEVVVEVLSQDAVRIAPGNPVLLERWGGSDPLEGRVRLVEPSGFTKVSALGVEEQRVNVIVDLLQRPEHRPSLGDNFRVDCRIIVWEADDVLQVPTSALFRIEQKWHLFKVVDQRAVLTPVEIGRDNGDFAELREGLVEGDRVVIYPSQSVADGVLIAPRS